MLEQAAGYTIPADSTQLEALATRLRKRNFAVLAAADADGAKTAVLALLPRAPRRTPASPRREDAGIPGELIGSGRYNFRRARLRQMNHETQVGHIRKLGAAPGLHARQRPGGDQGRAAGGSSQLGPYASGAGSATTLQRRDDAQLAAGTSDRRCSPGKGSRERTAWRR
jgi:hypothetical protein